MWNDLRNGIESLTPDNVFERKPQLLAYVDHLRGPEGKDAAAYNRLSPREREVLTMMLAGKRLKEIAADLDISVKTVTTHRARLMRKLGVIDNLGLYRYGIRHGLIGV